ncbi:MAG: hypothetical protein ABSC95_05815 [Acetobacteraceae bacterium]|jgi:hypothetical protein
MVLRLLITEVTEIHRGIYCVAGWDPDGSRMVRPLPDGVYWPRALIETTSTVPGTTVTVTPNRIRLNGDYPHRTEDLPIALAPIGHLPAAPVHWFGTDAPPSAATLAQAFGESLRHTSLWRGHRRGVHVPTGTRTCSLHGLRVPSHHLSFIEEDERLRALLQDAETRYNLPVSSRRLRETWREAGIAAVRRTLPAGTDLHVRVGLARGFGEQRDKCYVMLNGVLW